MSSERPLILLSNDDGVHARGLHALRDALRHIGDVVTVAPTSEQSAGSHSLTLSRPLRHQKVDDDLHAIDGTPADCIYVALYRARFLQRWPDLVVSGINHGYNLGSDVFYSGTVAAAREAALRGIPAIAFSLGPEGSFDEAAKAATLLVARMLASSLLKNRVRRISERDGSESSSGPTTRCQSIAEEGRAARRAHPARETRTEILQQAAMPSGEPGDRGPLLSVNFPSSVPYRGVRATRLGRRTYVDDVTVRFDPRGKEYYWIGGPGGHKHQPIEGSDTEAVDEGFVSVTPLILEATDPNDFGLADWVASRGVAEEDAR